MNAISNFLLMVPLTLWAGGMTMLMVFVAPMIFRHLPSRTLSANLVDFILHRIEMLKMSILISLVAAEFIKYFFNAPAVSIKEILITCLLVAYVLLVFVVDGFVFKKIQTLRSLIGSFDDPSPDASLQKQFGYWHGIMMSSITTSISLAFTIMLLRFVL